MQGSISAIPILVAIALIIIIGYAAEALFHKTKIPEILILISIGLILVPIGQLLPSNYVVTLRYLAPLFGDLALIVIMYNGGTAIKLVKGSFSDVRGAYFGVLDNIIPMVVVSVLMYILEGWPLIYGAIFGVILGETAVAVIIPIIKRMKMPSQIYNMLVMEVTINSVVSILLFTILLTAFTGGISTVGSVSNYIVDYISVALFIGIVWGLGWLGIQSRVRGAREYLPTLAVAILLYGIVSLLNGAAIISILIFAIMMGNYKVIASHLNLKIEINKKEHRAARAVERDLEFLLRTFFFVFIGMIAALSYFFFVVALLVTITLGAIRYVETKLFLGKQDMEAYGSLVFSMMPRGTVVAVLAALLYGIGGPYFDQIFYISFMVIVLTNIVSALLVRRTKLEVKKPKPA